MVERLLIRQTMASKMGRGSPRGMYPSHRVGSELVFYENCKHIMRKLYFFQQLKNTTSHRRLLKIVYKVAFRKAARREMIWGDGGGPTTTSSSKVQMADKSAILASIANVAEQLRIHHMKPIDQTDVRKYCFN